MKLSFSETDGRGNGRGVVVTLKETATPKDILSIARKYKKIGWLPSRRTKRAVETW